MSSKSHIVYTSHTEIYHETNQPQYAFDKFLGFDVEVAIEFPEIEEIAFNDGMLLISVKPGTELHAITGDNIQLYGTHLSNVQIDADGIGFTIKGGSFSAKIIETKSFIPSNYKKALS